MDASHIPAVSAFCKASGLNAAESDLVWLAIQGEPNPEMPSEFGWLLEDAVNNVKSPKRQN